MIRWALRGAIDEFERDGGCDASYRGDLIDASPLLGLIGMALGGLALARSRRTG